MNELQIKICQKFSQEYKDPVMGASQFVGSAFVSFKYQHYRDIILRKYHDNKKEFKMKGRQLKLRRASHPSEIIWENLGVDSGHRRWKIAVSFLILMVFLIVAFELLVLADPLRDFLVQKLENQAETLKAPLLLTFGGTCVSFITTTITIIINWFLEVFSVWLT